MTRTRIRGMAIRIAFIVFLGALLFLSAGRSDVPMFWAYLCILTTLVILGSLLMDPALLKERAKPGPGGMDYLGTVLIISVWVSQHIVAGLDVGRFHWSGNLPTALQVVALLVMAVALGVLVWAMVVNRFFSSVIRIQGDRGHRLVESGPYGYVRHPAYAAGLFFLVSTGIGLGSWLATIIGLILTFLIIRRTALEDSLLHEQLDGYAAYSDRVRYRLLPGVW